MSTLFSTFPKTTKAEWLAKVERDLKGKSLDDLMWKVTDDWTISPFAHLEDMPDAKPAITRAKTTNSWEIGERIIAEDAKVVNEIAHTALSGGVNALFFQLPSGFEDFSTLLKDVQLEWISTHFEGDLVEPFLSFLQTTNFNLRHLEGSWRGAAETTKLNSLLPLFVCQQVDGTPHHQGKEKTVEELTAILIDLNQKLQSFTDQPHCPIQLSIGIGKSYFINIAKIRAIHLLWQHLLSTYQVDIHLSVEAIVAADIYPDDQYQNMIQISTQALSAVIGGVDRLYIDPSDTKGTAFTRRIARNVQHLLQLESHLDHVVDPAAGSYYLEQMTEGLGERAWNGFLKHIGT
ncbi:MAG: methylmalonyl-CoA mutase family protein [Bacteroidota bacterium]